MNGAGGGNVPWKTLILLSWLASLAHSGVDRRHSIKNFFRGNLVLPSQQGVIRKAFQADVIVGYVMMSRMNWRNHSDLSFPNLVEITGSLSLMFITNLENLTGIFPKLRVIRGNEKLLPEHSFVLFNLPQLRNIGLINLRKIVSGSLYIEGTPLLCYMRSIDWSLILGPNRLVVRHFGTDHHLVGHHGNDRTEGKVKYREKGDILRTSNLPRIECNDTCPAKDIRTGMPCPVVLHKSGSNTSLCWNEFHCQTANCHGNCSDNEEGCYLDEGGERYECCHEECLAGCWGPGRAKCFSCRHFQHLALCTPKCPDNTYALGHICYSKEMCRELQPRGAWKALNGRCILGCPPNFKEMEEGGDCVPCTNERCWKECNGTLVNSVQSASRYEGCNILRGNLQVNFNDISKNAELLITRYLSDLRNITGFVDISGSFGLTSLTFLQSLEVIEGLALPNEYSLIIRDNYNLKKLLDVKADSKSLFKIMNGRVYLKNNPKLCSVDIKHFLEQLNQSSNSPNVTEYQDPSSPYCTGPTTNFSLRIENIQSDGATLKWNNPVEDAALLPYIAWIVHYQPLFKEDCRVDNVHYSCNSEWNSIEILPSFDRNSTENEGKSEPRDRNVGGHHSFRLTDMSPDQRYAVLVRLVFFGTQQRKGFYSETVCFETDVAKPSRVRDLRAESISARSVVMTWLPPRHGRGRIDFYVVNWFPSHLDEGAFKDRNYCQNGDSYFAQLQRAMLRLDYDFKEEREANETETRGTFGAKRPDIPPEHVKGNNDPASPAPAECCAKCTKGAGRNSGGFMDYIERLDDQIDQMNHRLIGQSTCPSPLSLVQKYLMSLENSTSVACTVGTEDLKNLSQAMLATGQKHSRFKFLSGRSTTLLLENLTNFQEYLVHMEACNINKKNQILCGSKSALLFQTWPSGDADLIDHGSLKSSVVEYNRTCSVNTSECRDECEMEKCTRDLRQSRKRVSFTWNVPKHPNGIIIAYWIKIQNVDKDAVSLPISVCINHEDFLEQDLQYHLQVFPGNYSWKVKVMSLAGNSTWSEPGYFSVTENLSDKGGNFSTATFTIIVVFVILMLVSFLAYVKCYGMKMAKRHEALMKISLNPNYSDFGKWEISKESIEIGDVIGRGQFGDVYRGVLKADDSSTPVAIKIVKDGTSSSTGLQFFQEILIMREFDSHHVVKLIGISYRERPCLMVMELLEFGDLLTFLRRNRQETLMTKHSIDRDFYDIAQSREASKDDATEHVGDTCRPVVLGEAVLLGMAVEVADGMSYLVSKGFVHRDLAARNCLVDSQLTVKISDFGLTQSLETADSYPLRDLPKMNNFIPVRWMAPEVLQAPVFSEKTDIWSYGILVWEMFALGLRPYVGMSNVEVKKFVIGGGRLEYPPGCPCDAKGIMESCWKSKPEERPTFTNVTRRLIKFAKPVFASKSYYCNFVSES